MSSSSLFSTHSRENVLLQAVLVLQFVVFLDVLGSSLVLGNASVDELLPLAALVFAL